MKGVNRIFLMGRLGSEPKMQQTKSGRSFTALNIATNRQFKEANGATNTHTDWHRVTVWGQQGERCAQYLSKGQPVMVEGYLSTYERELPEGHKIQQTTITALSVEFLPKGNSSESRVSPPDPAIVSPE